MSYKDDIELFALNSGTPLTQKITDRIGVPLTKSNVQRFSDGGIRINIDESVRGKDAYLTQLIGVPVNDNLMELLIMIDAVKRASARAIDTVLPYYGYARQDRKTHACEPITARLVANMLKAAGATRILSLDLHTPRIREFFNIPVGNLMGAPLLADYFLSNHLKRGTVIVSPDHGGVTRARRLTESLKAPIAIVDRCRSKTDVTEVMNIIGDVSGKRATIIDDTIGTAGTITLAAQALIDAGTAEVYVSATHAVLPGPTIDRLNNSKIKNLVLADSINQPEEKETDKLQLVSVGPPVGGAVKLTEQY